jgi:hypothetical protein
MKPLRAYYAHCMAIYNTVQEDRDVSLLTKLGFEVVNPNGPMHTDRDMDYYCRLAMSATWSPSAGCRTARFLRVSPKRSRRRSRPARW